MNYKLSWVCSIGEIQKWFRWTEAIWLTSTIVWLRLQCVKHDITPPLVLNNLRSHRY